MAAVNDTDTWLYIGSKNPDDTAFYYEKLGFKHLQTTGNGNQLQIWMIRSDVAICIHLDDRERIGLLFLRNEVLTLFQKLKNASYNVQWRNANETCFQINAFVGVHLRVQQTPTLPAYHKQEQLHLLESKDALANLKEAQPPLGVFGELTLNTDTLQETAFYWKGLGFEILFQRRKPFPWQLLSNGSICISLQENKLITPPSLVFYATNRPQTIKQLLTWHPKNLQAANSEVSAADENISLTTPDNHYIYLLQL